MKDFLPSKFAKEDGERLAELILDNKDRLQRLQKHLIPGLTDYLVTSNTGFSQEMQGNSRKLTFLMSTEQPGQFEIPKVFKQVPLAFVKALGVIYQRCDQNQKNLEIARASIFNELVASCDAGSDSLSGSLVNKANMLKLIEQIVKQKEYPLFETEQQKQELSEVLYSLMNLNIAEISV